MKVRKRRMTAKPPLTLICRDCRLYLTFLCHPSRGSFFFFTDKSGCVLTPHYLTSWKWNHSIICMERIGSRRDRDAVGHQGRLPHMSLWLYLALLFPTPDQTFRHSIELMVFLSASLPGMENLCPEKENTYAGTFIPDFCMCYVQVSCALGTGFAVGVGFRGVLQ